jgi:pSer/pThr/pTyr-binding forkhead associated (FHA) protein
MRNLKEGPVLMMKLELRNTRTSKSAFVDAKGAVFGREGGDADIKLADQGVSKKHARIYLRKGEWWLEDLNSANGTYVDDQRISQPVLLSPGLVFTMSRQQFEVIDVIEAQDDPTQAPKVAEEEAPDSTLNNEVPQREEEEEEEAEPPPRRGPSAKPAPAAAPRAKRAEAPAASRNKLRAAGSEPDAEQEIPPEEDVDPGFNVGYFMKAIPKATAYYLAAIPLMLVNPLGFVRKGIEDQKVPPMGRMQIMAYAFPALLISALVGFLCSLIVGIVAGALSIGSILPIGPLIGAVVGAVASGFVWHPVLEWIVRKLQGESDARSRSNMFAMAMTTVALLAIPQGLVVLFALIPLPFVGLVPAVISLAATLISVFVYYSWFKSFGVVKWFQLGLLGLGALAVLGTGLTMIGTVTASIRGIGSGPAVVAGAPATPATPEETQALIAKQQEEARKAIEAAQAKAAKAQPEPAKVEPAKVEPAKVEAEPAKVEVAKAETEPAKVEPAKVEAQPAKVEPEPAKATPARSTSYPEYRTKLAEIEKAIEEDPTVLHRGDGLLQAYAQLHRARFDAEEKLRRSQGRTHPSQALVNQRVREAEVYKATWSLVDQVHQKLLAR